MNKKLLLGASIIAIALIAVALIGRHGSQAPAPAPHNSGGVGPDFAYDHITVNGVTTWTSRQSFLAASTTLCSFVNPAGKASSTPASGGFETGSATSSLVSLSVNFATATGTAAFFDVSTSTTRYATATTAFAYAVPVPANTAVSFMVRPGGAGSATSSDTRLSNSLSFGQGQVSAGEFVNVKTSTPGLGGYTYTGGQCIATFQSISAL